MSRNLNRAVKRAAERKEQALEMYAVGRYGSQVQLADLHPDVKTLFRLMYILGSAHESKDEAALAGGFNALRALAKKYEGQQKDVLTPSEVDGTVSSTNPVSNFSPCVLE